MREVGRLLKTSANRAIDRVLETDSTASDLVELMLTGTLDPYTASREIIAGGAIAEAMKAEGLSTGRDSAVPFPETTPLRPDRMELEPHALQGIKVVDWTIWQFGPVAATMLGDLGADVVKIESLDGDPGRSVFSASGVDRSLPAGRNAYFEANQRNKRSVALDLKKPEGVEIVHRLVADTDVFIQNFRKGVAERLGLGYEALSVR